ncbi:MAG: LysM peptidoglycan-binding domain-containing protein [Treponema sp.]|jgi:hypothetical protein|nr:LysM peptidoglycan-binding domain-containing protein [Treponema sp.]
MKKIAAVLTLISLAFLIAACASQQTSNTEPISANSIEEAFQDVYDEHRSGLILTGAKDYTVVRGDTLSGLARKNYGDDNGYFFPLIMLASSDVVLDPDLIEPGMELTVPDLPKNLDNPNARKQLKEFLTDIAGIYGQKQKPEIQRDLLDLANSL